MGSVDIVLPSRETYLDSQNLRSDGAKIRRIIEKLIIRHAHHCE